MLLIFPCVLKSTERACRLPYYLFAQEKGDQPEYKQHVLQDHVGAALLLGLGRAEKGEGTPPGSIGRSSVGQMRCA